MAVETRPQPCQTVTPIDLVETLISAATDAIRNQAGALTCDVGRVRGLHLELEISNAGNVIDSVCWIERRGVHRRR
jgi:hypothetical protein